MPVGAAIAVGGAATAYTSRKNAKDASKASGEAADVQALSQEEALDYLKQINALPQELREKALQQLGDYYQVPGAPKDQTQLIAEAEASPLYAAIQGTREGAVDEMARYASATGSLRSGNAKAAFAREGQRVSNEALLESFNQAQENDRYERGLNLAGLSGLAGIDTGATEIATRTADIGTTRAAGILGGAQAKQQGSQNTLNALLGIAGLGIQAYGNGMIKI
jgi:hypothetical protein